MISVSFWWLVNWYLSNGHEGFERPSKIPQPFSYGSYFMVRLSLTAKLMSSASGAYDEDFSCLSFL